MTTATQTIIDHACWAAGTAAALWLGLRWFERANLYHPDRTLEGDPSALGIAFESFRVQAEGGAMVHGWYAEAGPASPVLLVSHGNGGNISSRLDKLAIFREAGTSVLMYDYRGYGLSSGRPGEPGTYADADAAYRWLTSEKKIPPSRVVFYGESLGGAVALEAALRHPCAGLILESSFTSVEDMGRRLFPFLPIRWMVRFRYDNIAKIPRLAVPVLVMHSRQDDVVPYDMGRSLYEAAPGPKAFFDMKGSHNDGFLETGPAYGRAVRSFLASLPSPARKEARR